MERRCDCRRPGKDQLSRWDGHGADIGGGPKRSAFPRCRQCRFHPAALAHRCQGPGEQCRLCNRWSHPNHPAPWQLRHFAEQHQTGARFGPVGRKLWRYDVIPITVGQGRHSRIESALSRSWPERNRHRKHRLGASILGCVSARGCTVGNQQLRPRKSGVAFATCRYQSGRAIVARWRQCARDYPAARCRCGARPD